MYSVYKITNIVNGKCYIGLTKNTVEHRWKAHVDFAKRPRKTVSVIADAIEKYGADRFSVEALYSAFDQAAALAAERSLITDYKSLVGFNGYNIRKGGEAGLAPGFGLKGTKCPASKLTDEAVIWLRSVDNISDEDIAKEINVKFGLDVKTGAVTGARLGKTWRHLNEMHPPKLIGMGKRRTAKNNHAFFISKRPDVRAKIAAATSKRLSGNAQPWKSKLSLENAMYVKASAERAVVLADRFGVSLKTIYNIKNGKGITYGGTL